MRPIQILIAADMETISFLSFVSGDSTHLRAAADLWSAACGSDLSITPAFVAYNTRPTTGVEQRGQIAFHTNQPVGFILASAVISSSNPPIGWIDAIAVAPSAQRQGIGTQLLTWGCQWLKEQGSQVIYLGGSMRPFTPGLPTLLEQDTTDDTFFIRRGFQRPDVNAYAWDMAHNLRSYQRLYTPPDPSAEVHPLKSTQQKELFHFLERNFPDRWLFEYQEHVKEGGRLSDYLLLWREDQVAGFCIITLPDSVRPLERYFPQRLPRPWGQLGSIGIDNDLRGQGYGAFMIDEALLHLQALGVAGCVIDWTSLLGLYSKFGFTPYRRYLILERNS